MWCLPQRWVGWVTQVTNLGDLVASTGSGTINWQSRKGGCNVHLVWDKNLSNKFICLVLDQTLLLPLLEMSYGGAGHKYNNSDLLTRILHREEKTNPNEAFFLSSSGSCNLSSPRVITLPFSSGLSSTFPFNYIALHYWVASNKDAKMSLFIGGPTYPPLEAFREHP